MGVFRAILCTAVMVLLLVVSAAARQWTYRSDGAGFEAELLDVKGGNVVLKKPDGSLVTVPLGKLSLGDIRYIEETLAAAESRITGGKPAEAKQPPPAPQKTESAANVDLTKLRYNWQKGKTYVYRLNIVVDRGYYNEELSGNVSYKVKTVDEDEISLVMTPTLTRGEKVTAPGRIIVTPGGRMLFFATVPPAKEALFALDPFGKMLRLEQSSSLPYLLGDLSQLMVEQLPAEPQSQWTVSNEMGLVVVEAHYPFCRYLSSGFREGVPAAEKTVYTVKGRTGKFITITKQYELTTASTIGGKPRFEAGGQGTLQFDTEQGVCGKSDYSLRVVVRDANTTEEIPVRISYRLLSPEDLARAAKEEEEAKKEAERIRQEKIRPLTAAELEAASADLSSHDPVAVSRALKLLAEKQPSQPNPQIAQALTAILLSDEHAPRRAEAAEALINWATADSVPALNKALQDQWPPVRSAAIEALCKFKPKESVKPIAQLLTQGMTRGAAGKFLKAIGSEAEEVVLPYLEDKDAWVRAEVCSILEVIGTKKSLPALEKALTDESFMVNGNARKALAAIKARQ